MNTIINQSLNLYGSKAKATKHAKRSIKSLKDRFAQNKMRNQKANDTDKFVFTYDRLMKECEDLNKKESITKQIEVYLSALKALLKEAEINEKTHFDFFKERVKYKKDLYSKLITRCLKVLDNAVLKDASQGKIDKITKLLENFVTKLNNYNKPMA